MNNVKVNVKKLLSQLEELGAKGVGSDGARTKLALTPEDKAGRDLVVSYMKELDLDVRVDKVGNVFGIYNPDAKGKIPAPKTAVMIGSHIDSVINAGHLDGCLGVLSGLAIIRAFKDAGVKPSSALVAAFFTNEEGVRFQPDMLGSLAYAEPDTLNTHLNAVSIDGKILKDELKAIGYAGDEEPGLIVPKRFFEYHIEQGPVLDDEHFQIGVVTGVQGISWHRVNVRGEANHGGTTPMRYRVDAGLVMSRVATALRDYAKTTENTLAMVGHIDAKPGLINVIPDNVTFTVDLRDPNNDKLKQVENLLDETLKKASQEDGTTYTKEAVARFEPVFFDEELINLVESSAKKLGFTHRRIVSGAGHDAQMLARICPTTMIFVPSTKGISHNPLEKTNDADISNGLNVLLEVVKASL